MNYSTYRKCKDELMGIAAKLGVAVLFGRSGHRHGSFQPCTRVIHICIKYTGKKRETTYLEELFILAHELRHAEHTLLGLYGTAYAYLVRKKVNIGVAIRAELDCNKWAFEFLRDRGLMKKMPYKYSSYPKESLFCWGEFTQPGFLEKQAFEWEEIADPYKYINGRPTKPTMFRIIGWKGIDARCSRLKKEHPLEDCFYE